ncbi:MAG: EF2563 family selenium-dependent molybdenum hydroxylase system protein [Chloroflexi bacterium]|nr:EF2563 family selenium-dependent molybdenum hydroxylase system protein [Chloroflexota bacterium]
MPSLILIRGGGDLATGVAIRLLRTGLRVVVTELSQPLAVRRTVSFAEAIYSGEISIEGITAQRVDDPSDTLRILSTLGKQQIPLLVDPGCTSAKLLHPAVIVDGRMTKCPPEPIGYSPALYIGLGPGFEAGVNCQAVIETRRGHTLGRVFWRGGPDPDTGQPDGDPARLLRAPCDGVLVAHVNIGEHIEKSQVIAEIDDGQLTTDHRPSSVVHSPLPGILRGLLHPGLTVTRGLKIGDIDPRDDPRLCQMVSDKALSIGGGVLEAILSRPDVRSQLWT